MRVYVPLARVGDRFDAKTEYFDIRDWRDAAYVDFFESELAESHTESEGRVQIDGSEFANCKIFVPNDKRIHDAYVVTNEELVPMFEHIEESDENGSAPSINWIQKRITTSKVSENFYHNYVVDLSTKYVSPQVMWDDDSYSVLHHPSAIRKGSRVLLVGQPGAGKTSFARYLTQLYLNDGQKAQKKSDAPLVFYFQLRDFAHKSNEFGSWLSDEEEQVGKNHVVRQGSKGRIMCVFDGLDELNESDRWDFSDWLSKFVETRPSTSTIVTSRELSSLNIGIWQTFTKAKLMPFDRSRVDEYCNLVLEDRVMAKSFTSVLDSNPDLQEFLRNPFSLSLALGMFLLRGSLPFNIGVLCKELVAQLIERWDSRRGISRFSELSVESVNATLGRLAYRLQANRDAQFAPELLEDILPFELEGIGARAVLQDLSERTGLISEVSTGSWAFGHRYLQDFFCANYMVERASGLGNELSRHGADADWVDVWRQVGQLCQDPEFFALSQSREASDGIKSIDRMVSSLLSHEGLSKSELYSIVEGIADEIGNEGTNLPGFAATDYGLELDCNHLDNQSILILAKTVTHISYLRTSNAGRMLLGFLQQNSQNHFSEVFRKILLSENGAVPLVQVSALQIHLK